MEEIVFCFLPTKLFEPKKFPQNESVNYWLLPLNKEIRVVKSEKRKMPGLLLPAKKNISQGIKLSTVKNWQSTNLQDK